MANGVSGQQRQMQDAPKIGVIYGTVVDSASGEPVPYASISVVNQRGGTIVTGGITKENGEFHITEIPLGRHSVVVEYIGYGVKKIGPITFLPFGDNVTTHNLETIPLVQKVLELGEVDVTADRPMFIQTAQKRIFSAEQNTLSTGGSAIDVLRQIPGVEVDMDDNVSLRGSSQVNMMIDGKPSVIAGGNIKELLRSIPAANIADVEVMTNPGAKYDPEGMAGIINIVLKENKFAGLNGNLSSSADSQRGSNLSGQINWRTVSFNTFANVGARRYVRQSSGDSYRTMQFDAFESVLDQASEGSRLGDNLFLKTGFEYFIDPMQSLALSTTLNGGDGGNDDLTSTVEYNPFESQYFRTTDGANDRGGYDVNLNYDRKFKNPKQKFSSFVRYSSGGSDGLTEFFTTPVAGFDEMVRQNKAKNGNEGKDSNFELKADYVHPFENGNVLEVGLDSRMRTRDDSQLAFVFNEGTSAFVDDSLFSNRFMYDEDVHAAGAPQLLQVQASYARRVNRPRSRQLNPFMTRQDMQNMRTGNPFLKPEYVDSYEINFGRYSRGLSLNFSPYYRHLTDKISRHKIMTEEGTSIATYENISEQISKGVEYSIIGSLGKKFRLVLSGSIYRDEINTDIYGEDYNNTATGQRYVINSTWNMNPTTELMFFMFYRPAQEIAIGRMGSMSWSAISLKKKFLDEKLSISARMGDPFNLSGLYFETWGENWYQESSRDFFSQRITVSLEYRFGKIEDRSRFSRNRNGSEQGNRDDFEIY